MNRRANVQPLKAKKPGLFGDEDDDTESNLLFNAFPSSSTNYRQEREMMASPTPSQLSTFGGGLKVDPLSMYGTNNFGMSQRGMSNSSFLSSVGGVSNSLAGMNLGSGSSAFPLSLQQQRTSQQARPQAVSPNRGLFNWSQQQNLLSQLSSQVAVAQQVASLGLNQLKQQQQQQQQQQRVGNTLGSGLISVGSGSNFSRTLADVPQPSLDWSDFPSLTNRSAQQNQMLTARNYVGMVSKPQQDSTPEFQIQQEDFPALPGAQNPTTSASESLSKPPLTSMGSYDMALKDSGNKPFTDKAVGGGSGQQRRGIQTHPDGTVSNIPAGMVTDQFGIVGLLTFIRAAETDANLVALAPGIDLTTLGLNLNSPDNLYSTFQSPWADAPCRPQDIDYHVPAEYLTNIYIRDKLAPIKFNRYQEDLLFYLFYVNGGDVLQLAAAAELYNRDWRYHKEERVWITRAPGMEPLAKTSTYERGTYVFFDVHNWRKIPKEFHLEYNKLEDRPQLPDMHPSASTASSSLHNKTNATTAGATNSSNQ